MCKENVNDKSATKRPIFFFTFRYRFALANHKLYQIIKFTLRISHRRRSFERMMCSWYVRHSHTGAQPKNAKTKHPFNLMLNDRMWRFVLLIATDAASMTKETLFTMCIYAIQTNRNDRRWSKKKTVEFVSKWMEMDANEKKKTRS